MKFNLIKTGLLMLLGAALVGCEFDNYEEPKSTLEGRIVYQNEALALRSDGVQLELWQHGYDLFQKIPVYVDQDGAFSAQLFDGDYKLTLIRGNGPWLDRTDSIDVQVRGNQMLDVEVTPYYTLNNPSFAVSDTNLTAAFNVTAVNEDRPIEYVSVVMGRTILTDIVRNDGSVNFSGAEINISSPNSLQVTIPAGLRGRSDVFVRIGLKVAGIQELIYTHPEKVPL